MQQKRNLLDVRSKIIEKKRSKIGDARDHLAKLTKSNIVDARLKLLNNNPKNRPSKNKLSSLPKRTKRPSTSSLSSSSKRGLTLDEDLLYDEDDYEMAELDTFKLKVKGELKRTFHNDIAYKPKSMPPLPHFNSSSLINNDRASPTFQSDPFDW